MVLSKARAPWDLRNEELIKFPFPPWQTARRVGGGRWRSSEPSSPLAGLPPTPCGRARFLQKRRPCSSEQKCSRGSSCCLCTLLGSNCIPLSGCSFFHLILSSSRWWKARERFLPPPFFPSSSIYPTSLPGFMESQKQEEPCLLNPGLPPLLTQAFLQPLLNSDLPGWSGNFSWTCPRRQQGSGFPTPQYACFHSTETLLPSSQDHVFISSWTVTIPELGEQQAMPSLGTWDE